MTDLQLVAILQQCLDLQRAGRAEEGKALAQRTAPLLSARQKRELTRWGNTAIRNFERLKAEGK